MTYEDRKIYVTVPFPDSIELITDVFNHHLLSPYAMGEGAKAIYGQIDDQLREWIQGYKTGEVVFFPSPRVTGGTKAQAVYLIAYDPVQPLHRARLTLSRREGDNYPVWSVKLEFSASKAGTTGLVQLTAAIDDALPLNVNAVLGSFQVSRVDPAIDLIGAEPLDLIAHVPNPGKRLVYVGQHGRPESVYLYEAKKPIHAPPKSLTYNTRGPLRLKLYERREYFRQLMIAPPYGECPVTRAETEIRWKKKSQRPYLADLASISNLLEGRRVAYAAAIAKMAGIANEEDWVQFCLAAMGGGVSKSQSKWTLGAGFKYRALYSSCKGDLLNEAMWSRWADGIANTGLDKWLAIAEVNKPPSAD